VKNKILEKIRNSKTYALFRRVRYFLHLIPAWNWFVGFAKHYFGGLYDRTDRHHLFLFSGGLAFFAFRVHHPDDVNNILASRKIPELG